MCEKTERHGSMKIIQLYTLVDMNVRNQVVAAGERAHVFSAPEGCDSMQGDKVAWPSGTRGASLCDVEENEGLVHALQGLLHRSLVKPGRELKEERVALLKHLHAFNRTRTAPITTH